MHTIPTVNEQGAELEKAGYVLFGKNTYNQVSDNCFEIASFLADKHGFCFPSSKAELTKIVNAFKKKNIKAWGDSVEADILSRPRSYAFLLIREPDNPQGMHVTLQLYNREYNYGKTSGENFPVEIRLPLQRKSH